MKHKGNIYDENFETADSDEVYYDEDATGYSIVDGNGAEILKSKKNTVEEEEDEAVIASPIPQNEQTVLIDNAKLSGLDIGQRLELKISREGGSVLLDNEKVGDFKPAFINRLYETRLNQFATCELFSQSPPMVKLYFFEESNGKAILIK